MRSREATADATGLDWGEGIINLPRSKCRQFIRTFIGVVNSRIRWRRTKEIDFLLLEWGITRVIYQIRINVFARSSVLVVKI